MSTHDHARTSGVIARIVSMIAGILLGLGVAFVAPPPEVSAEAGNAALEVAPDAGQSGGAVAGEAAHEEEAHGGHETPPIPLWLTAPFVTLLLMIALMPFINERWWARRYPDVAFVIGGLVTGYYLGAYGAYGRAIIVETGLEYFQFIALIASLYIAAGAIVIDVRSRGRPLVNTAMLTIGAVLANVVGTTGASMLLIQPFLRINEGRIRPLHVVFFILIVSNCGGCLTPIGDPPLYLGYIKGVPFLWTLEHLWPAWLLACGVLIAMFFAYDVSVERRLPDAGKAPGRDRGFPRGTLFAIEGWRGPIALALIIAAVFVDPAVDPLISEIAPGAPHIVVEFPIGAALQMLIALAVLRLAPPRLYKINNFTFHPVQEVGYLFVGIFLAMMPALAYLSTHADALPLRSPGAFFFATGTLSAFLDNAPTYLNFLQTAFGLLDAPLTEEGIHVFLDSTYETKAGHAAYSGVAFLEAISLGAVFFGAATYIGNGPNFMVRAIANAQGVRMPSFLGYLVRAGLILAPVLIAVWLLFLRG